LPTAELIKPKSYNTLGHIWRQGEVVEVTDEVAAILADNPRFAVRDAVQTSAKIVKKPGKPTAEALSAAIRTAADQLDPDNERHSTVNGKPECHALEEALGYAVTAAERDAAYGLKSSFKIKKKLIPPAEVKSDTVSHLPAEEKAVPATDPTTLNAIEVN
jgi:hypothetical protein